MSDTVDQEQAAKPEPVASVASEILPSAREDNPAHHREKTEVQQDFFASRGFKKFAAVLFTLLVLVLCSSALTGLAKSSTESFATSILTLFGVLITGIFVFMALRIDSGARKEAQTIAHAEARDQAEFAARLIAPEEARRVAVDVAKSVARDESRKVAKTSLVTPQRSKPRERRERPQVK